jgi:DDE superfamily endonuclease
MPANSSDIEGRIAAASTAMDANPSLKATVAARQFDAPYYRLLRRRRGIPPSHTRGGHNKKLSTVQDQALRDYLVMLYNCGMSANQEAVRVAANRLLFYSTGDIIQTVSKRWTKAWIKRQSEYLKTLKSKPLSAKRLAAHIVEDVEEHFKAFKKCKEYWGIQDEDIYNFDETGFQIGVTSGENVLVPRDITVVYSADPENKELITSVETLNYGGQKVPPMIIFAGAYHLRRYFKNDLDGDILFTRSESGYSNDKLGVRYLEHFNYFTESKSISKYRMLIFDGHGSHLTQEFLDYCWLHHIRPFQLPPHTTHLLQPLDVGVFQSLKYNFKKEIRREVFQGAREISRVDFFAFFQRFHNKTFKNIRIHKSAFQKTGLIPYNPILVLSKMKEYNARHVRPQTPPILSSPPPPSSPLAFSTPPIQVGWSQFNTPLTIRTRKSGVEYIKKRHFESVEQGVPLTPSVVRVAEKVEKASETSILRGALSTHRLYDLSDAEVARKRRKEESGKVVQKYGEIRVYHARKQIEAEEEEESRVVNMRLKRLEKGWRKQYSKVLKELKEKAFLELE